MKPTDKPTISIIIPVLNEAKGIMGSIAHLREIAGDTAMEIIVVDGDPGGSTINAIIDTTVRKLTSDQGRARQMNCGAASASGEILLFLHADTLLPGNAFVLVLAALKDRRVVAGAFDLGIDSSRPVFRITETYVAVRTRLTRIPFGDQAIFIRRDHFEKINGYQDLPLMEDVELMKRIRKQGQRIAIIPEKVRTSPRRYEQEGVLSCTFRNLVLQLLYALGVPPERLVKWYP